ncbi:DUF1453 domain-containing protein [Dyella jejuensis]|uniref:DUF1453 domain-containing protein n=1 Tax=Dyella jejuensis TaxID=1432009 RepID=A0ABW8JLT8_9GAMM
MAPSITMPLIMVPLMALAVWRRVRNQFGLQPIRPWKMVARVVFFAVFGIAIGLYAMRDTQLLAGLGGGLLVGAGLGLLGLRLSRFELHPVKGDCYVPNPYIGAVVIVLFLGRLVWRFAMLSPQWRDPMGTTSPIRGPELGQSPLTLALSGLVVGYYVCYFAGLLIHYQRIVRSRPRQSA